MPVDDGDASDSVHSNSNEAGDCSESDCRSSNIDEPGELTEETSVMTNAGQSHTSSHTGSIDGEQGSIESDEDIDTKKCL